MIRAILILIFLLSPTNLSPLWARGVDHGLVHSINAKLKRWVKPTGKCHNERLATFYDSGRRTANGERFDWRGHTAAHMKLPFGTWLTITNPHNGRSVSVRINDRGPATIAWIDLSRGAANAIGMKSSSYVCVSE